MQTEIYDRGFDYLEDSDSARVKRWLNEAYLELCELYPWSFLETTSTGVAPLAITDVREVLSVVDTTNNLKLSWVDRRTITDYNPDLSVTGNPTYWHLTDTTLNVYPINTSASLSVWYIKVPTELSADGDLTLVPSRFQHLVLDGASIKAYKDSDNFDAVKELRAEYDRGVQVMVASLMRHSDSPDYIVSVYPLS